MPALCVTFIVTIMHVELIPVIEVGYDNQDVKAPAKYPYWENPEEWDQYHKDCYLKAGLNDDMKPYLKGSSFYRLSDISNNNLIRLVIDHTEEFRKAENNVDEICSFFGGYVLRVNGYDKYFPQCCGELSDIMYWERLAQGQQSYYEGHPAPGIAIRKDVIEFDFSDDESDPFRPIPPDTNLKIDRASLKLAIEVVKAELHNFGKRLNEINIQEELNIPDIDDLLIWRNPNYK